MTSEKQETSVTWRFRIVGLVGGLAVAAAALLWYLALPNSGGAGEPPTVEPVIPETAEVRRLREEATAHTVNAQDLMQQGEWQAAVKPFERVAEIAHEIGDNELLTSSYAGLGRCWLELGDIDKAGVYVRQVLLERPTEADTARLHARMAAAVGNFESAASVMRGARSAAGDGWTAEDEELFAWYQAKAAQAAPEE